MVFLLVMKAWYALALIGLTFLLTFFLILLLFRGTYDVCYVINRQGVSCHTQAEQKNRVRRLAFFTFILGLLKQNPTVAGACLLSAANTDIRLQWKRIRKVKAMGRQGIIRLYGGFGESITLFCTKENYMEVKQHIHKWKGDRL